MTPGQAEALTRLWSRYGVALPAEGQTLSPQALFGRVAPLALDIGFGMGEATAQQAAQAPDVDVLAVEVHTPGVANLLRLLEAGDMHNVRVLEGDAHAVLDALPRAALEQVRVFFPDPWPKSKHAKRRLIGPPFLQLIANCLAVGGRLHVATDDAAYLDGALSALAGNNDLEFVSRDRGVRPVTRFEQRARAAGRASYDVVALRR